MATYVITVAGTTRTINGPLSIAATANGRDTLSCTVDALTASWRPAIDDEVIVTEDGTRIFGGIVNVPAEAGFGGVGATTAITTQISAIDFNALADRRFIITGGFAAGTLLKAALTALLVYLPGVTLHASQVDGPALPELVYTARSITSILDEFTALTGYVRDIDYSKVLRMWQPGTQAAPFDVVDGNTHVDGDITVETTPTQYANRVVLSAGTAILLDKVDTFTGTGAQVDFVLTYPMSVSYGYVTHAGVYETFGPGATWTFAASVDAEGLIVHTITRTTGAPAAAAVITFTYVAQFPLIVTANDAGEQAAHGVQEIVISAPDIFIAATAQALADAYLPQYTARPKTVTYNTFELGLKPGQVQTITIAKRNLTGTFLITDVKTATVGNVAKRSVTAIEGTLYQGSWRDTFKQWSSGGGAAPVVTGVPTVISWGSGPVIPSSIYVARTDLSNIFTLSQAIDNASTSALKLNIANNSGEIHIGVEGSTGGTGAFSGSLAYAGIVGTIAPKHLQFGTGGAINLTQFYLGGLSNDATDPGASNLRIAGTFVALGKTTFPVGSNAPLITGASGGNFLSLTSTGTGATSWVQYLDTSSNFVLYNGADRLKVSAAGALTMGAGITHGSATLLTTTVALTNGAAAAAGTLTNAPAAGNPTKWVPINDNGTTRYIPAW